MIKPKIYKLLTKGSWISLLLSSYVLFTYYFFNGFWYSSIGTILILLFCFLLWNKEVLKITGLHFNLKTAFKSLIIAGFSTIGSLLLMLYISSINGIEIQFTSWKDYFHDVFYVLNEEIILGAIVLFTLVKKQKIHSITASIGLAVVFSLLHFVFYKWTFAESGNLKITTLISLFLIGFVRNNIILQSKHIAYSWALHFGWIVIMFGSNHQYIDTRLSVSEPERFNIYLGSFEMILTSSILALASLLLFKKSKITR